MRLHEIRILPAANIKGDNVFPVEENIVGLKVYHQTNKLDQILKSGFLKPKPDITGEREFGIQSSEEYPHRSPIGIFVSKKPKDWVGTYLVSFIIESTDEVYRAYSPIGHLLVINKIPITRLTIENDGMAQLELERAKKKDKLAKKIS